MRLGLAATDTVPWRCQAHSQWSKWYFAEAPETLDLPSVRGVMFSVPRTVKSCRVCRVLHDRRKQTVLIASVPVSMCLCSWFDAVDVFFPS